MGFILTKITALWNIVPCSLLYVDRRFIAVIIKAVITSEASINYKDTI
jgi:hypothetical protein